MEDFADATIFVNVDMRIIVSRTSVLFSVSHASSNLYSLSDIEWVELGGVTIPHSCVAVRAPNLGILLASALKLSKLRVSGFNWSFRKTNVQTLTLLESYSVQSSALKQSTIANPGAPA